MVRFVLAVSLIFVSIFALAQNSSSDPQAQAIASKTLVVLTGGIQVQDATLLANVTSISGSDYLTGTATFQAKGTTESRIDLNLGNVTRSEIRSSSGGVSSGNWTATDSSTAGAPLHANATHNCWTDAVWFFPALTVLNESSNSKFVFSYVGQEEHAGVTVQHLRVFQAASGVKLLQHLSTMDFYLDPVTSLPLAIAFQIHPDNDAGTDIPTEIRFANYQAVNGVQVPFHIQRLVNGGVILDATVSSAVFNTDLPDSTFSLQ